MSYLISPSYFRAGDRWVYYVINRSTYPDLKEWPAMESYFDVHWLPSMNEYTVDNGVTNDAYTWGYLAAHAAPAAKE